MNRNRSSGLVRLQRITDEKLINARHLRRNMTEAEAILWQYLRNRKLGGFKFRRQQIVEGFITDYFCEKAKLAVEVDGGIHTEPEQRETDEHREKVFQARGVFTFRIKNEDVQNDLGATLKRIRTICLSRAKM